jgi:hypothetical protein
MHEAMSRSKVKFMESLWESNIESARPLIWPAYILFIKTKLLLCPAFRIPHRIKGPCVRGVRIAGNMGGGEVPIECALYFSD